MDGFSGYALILSKTGTWQFYLAAGGEKSPIEMSVEGFSVVTGSAALPGTWSHIAVTFDGAIQSIYMDGQLANFSVPDGPFRENVDRSMTFAGSCGEWLKPYTCQGNVQFTLDEMVFYDLALPASALAMHASLLSQTMHAQFKVRSHNVLSPCTTASCALKVKALSTVSV